MKEASKKKQSDEGKIHWHPGFCGASEIELIKNKGNYSEPHSQSATRIAHVASPTESSTGAFLRLLRYRQINFQKYGHLCKTNPTVKWSLRRGFGAENYCRNQEKSKSNSKMRPEKNLRCGELLSLSGNEQIQQ